MAQQPLRDEMSNLFRLARLPITYVVISCALFLLATARPALVLAGRPEVIWSGWSLFLTGYLAIFSLQVGWYANVPYFLSMLTLLMGKWTATIWLVAVAFVLAADTLLLYQLPVVVPGYMSRGRLLLQRLEDGFFLWIASMAVVAIGAVVLRSEEPLPRRSVDAHGKPPPNNSLEPTRTVAPKWRRG